MRLGLDRLWLVLALALPALASLIVPLPAVDLAYQVRTGEMILAGGAIPAGDTFTYTVAGAPWVDQQWLAQVLLALGFRAGGWELLAVLRAALVVLIAALVAATAVARGSGPRTAAILALVAFGLASPALALRPQLFGIAIFAGLLLIVVRRSEQPLGLLLVPLLVVAWANIHGSVVLAPVLLGYAWLDDLVRDRPWRPALLALVAATAATLVNPFGIGVWAYALGIGTDAEIAGQVAEWQRTTPFTVPGLLFYGSAVAVLAVAWWGRARLRWPDRLWLATLFVVGAWAVRGLAWWPIGLVPIVVTAVPPAGGSAVGERRANRLNAAVAGILGAAILVALPWWRPTDPLAGREGLLTFAPSDLALALREQAAPGAHVFTRQAWASWFEWAVPDARYFLDSRFELFPADVWRDYDAIAAGGDPAAEALERWPTDLVVIPADASFAVSGWAPVYRDDDGTILGRTGAMTGRLRGSLVPSGGDTRPRGAVESAHPGEEDSR